MNREEIQALILKLDTSDPRGEEIAWRLLKPLGPEVIPYLFEFYPKAKKWQQRVSLVFHSIRFARTSEAAYELGLVALGDKSYRVRWRGCGLLAYSLRKDALDVLKTLLNHPNQGTVGDAQAAIDAIQAQNHHRFVDRNRSGQIFWEVNPGDKPGSKG